MEQSSFQDTSIKAIKISFIIRDSYLDWAHPREVEYISLNRQGRWGSGTSAVPEALELKAHLCAAPSPARHRMFGLLDLLFCNFWPAARQLACPQSKCYLPVNPIWRAVSPTGASREVWLYWVRLLSSNSHMWTCEQIEWMLSSARVQPVNQPCVLTHPPPPPHTFDKCRIEPTQLETIVYRSSRMAWSRLGVFNWSNSNAACNTISSCAVLG